MKKAAPWLIALLALGAIYPVAQVVKRSDPVSPPAAASAPPVPAALSAPVVSVPPPWREPVRVLREFFALPADPAASRQASVDELVEQARTSGYDLRLLVALVPLPGDSRFDQALDGIQRGFAQSEYLADRAWLPWSDGREAGQRAPGAPGILLFRKREADGSGRLAVLFLVGETPKAGIRKDTLHEALDLAADLQRAAREPTVGILGPSYSGSAESLRLALTAWRPWERANQGIPERPPLRFRIATGAATANGLEDLFRQVDPAFCRTVLADSDQNEAALGFLQNQMGWDLRRAALLTESDTAYGRSVLTQELTAGAARRPRRRRDELILVPFPSHISDLRNAFQEAKGTPDPKQASSVEAQIQAGRKGLDLDLADRERGVDLVPISDPLTIRGNERMLSHLLQTVSREGVRYTGILATNVRDKLFLAEEVRQLAPDTVLFTFDSDLLYAHPQYAPTMDGTLVFSSAPLFTEGAPWLPASLLAQGRQRLQFTSGFQQGTYEAVRYLLGAGPLPRPQVWIAAVGNGSLWPIARLPAGRGTARLCGAAPLPGPTLEEGDGFAAKDDLQLLLAAILLALLAAWLGRVALIEPVAGAAVDVSRGNRRLLAGGLFLLTSAAGVLLAVMSLPLWSRRLRAGWLWAGRDPAEIGFLLAMVAVYAFLADRTARTLRTARTMRTSVAVPLGVLGGLLLFGALAAGVLALCIPGDQIELFHLRARALSSGLSPLVSLAALGGAIYAWLINELVRRRLIARMAIDCPLQALGGPVAAGCERAVDSLRDLLARTVPAGRRVWLLPAVAFLPPAALLWGTVQPIAETKGYGRFFLLLLVAAVALAALSFYRFVRLWAGARRLLDRLDQAPPALAAAFAAVGQQLDWRPIRSFGWPMPPFRTLVLSLARLRALETAGLVEIPGYPEAVDAPLRDVFEHEAAQGSEGSAREIESRNALERILAKASRDLLPAAAAPVVKEFLALRMAAFLRYVFAHMRSCLIGSLLPGLLILIAVTSYAFQPKQFVSLAVWLGLALAVGLTGLVFVQMDRNATLSRIGDTQPGKVTFDRPFLANLFTYVGLPLLGLIAAQFPEVGRLLGSLADQLLRVTGGG